MSALRAVLFLASMAAVMPAAAQDIEPRNYSNAPVGVNFLVAGALYTRGGLEFAPALPADNENLRVASEVVAFARTFAFAGRSGKWDVVIPYGSLSGSVDFAGQHVTREANGLVDPRFRIGLNLLGSPALPMSEFRRYKQDLIVGASLQVVAPLGQYDPSRLVNLGNHRWSFKPEIAMSKARGPWTVELAAAAILYTVNHEFFGGQSRAQRPIASLQANAIYSLPSGSWLSLGANYFTGGRTTVNGALNSDLQQNWRFGATWSIPVNPRNSVKLYASSGVAARTGNDYDLAGIAWQYRWGGGL